MEPISILFLFGREISDRSIDNLKRIKKLVYENPEYEFVRNSPCSVLKGNIDLEEFRKNYFKNTNYVPKVILEKSKKRTFEIAVKQVHPKYGSLSKKVKSELRIVHVCVYYCDMLITASNGKGRPQYAILAAKNSFVPHIDLNRPDLGDKLKTLETRADKKAEKERLVLKKRIVRLNKEAETHGVDFKPNFDKIKELSRMKMHELLSKGKVLTSK